MMIKLLVLQRKDDGGPEVLTVVDEWTLDNNPGWWPAEVANHKREIGDDAEAWAIVTVDLDDNDLERALDPQVGARVRS